MKIGVNALAVEKGGSVTYLDNIIEGLLSEEKVDSAVIYISNSYREGLSCDESEKLVFKTISFSNYSQRMVCEQILLPISVYKEDLDVLFCPFEIAPLFNTSKTVLGNQNANLYYETNSEKSLFQKIRYSILRNLFKLSVKRSDATIFVSKTSMIKAIHELNLYNSDTFYVHHGVSKRFFDSNNNHAANIQTSDKNILFVSDLYPHKNVEVLIRAFSMLPMEIKSEYDLIIIGSKDTNQAYIDKVRSLVSDLEEKTNIRLIGRIEPEKMPTYYDNSDVFVFPSRLESFGFPVIEAMASGTAVITSSSAALPEIAGDSALYFDPNDPAQLSVLIENVLKDKKLQKELENRGKERAKNFDWDDCVSDILSILNKF